MNYVYFSEGTVGAASTAAAYPAENFMGFESAGATTGILYFKPIVNLQYTNTEGDDNEAILVTFPSTATSGNLNFAQIAEIVCGAINGSKPSGAMTVIADEANGNYISPLTGTVTMTVGA